MKRQAASCKLRHDTHTGYNENTHAGRKSQLHTHSPFCHLCMSSHICAPSVLHFPIIHRLKGITVFFDAFLFCNEECKVKISVQCSQIS